MDYPLGAVSGRRNVGKVLVLLFLAGLAVTAAVAAFALTRAEDEANFLAMKVDLAASRRLTRGTRWPTEARKLRTR